MVSQPAPMAQPEDERGMPEVGQAQDEPGPATYYDDAGLRA
jgi:hypothetical protein